MVEEVENSLKRSIPGIIEVLSQRSPRESEEVHENLSLDSQMCQPRFEPCISRISLKHYHYTTLHCVSIEKLTVTQARNVRISGA
jgi:hypothetical protein